MKMDGFNARELYMCMCVCVHVCVYHVCVHVLALFPRSQALPDLSRESLHGNEAMHVYVCVCV